MPPQDPTADYRKYPKGPNFLLIVILASVAILIILAVALFTLRGNSGKLMPHKPDSSPNSLLVSPDSTSRTG